MDEQSEITSPRHDKSPFELHGEATVVPRHTAAERQSRVSHTFYEIMLNGNEDSSKIRMEINSTDLNRIDCLTEKVYASLRKNIHEINLHLNSIRRNFFSLNGALKGDKFEIINLQGKRYLIEVDASPNHEENSIVYIIGNESNEMGFVGVKLESKGRLWAGRFDINRNLYGIGVYINKKGKVFLGNRFKNYQLNSGKILQTNNMVYEGGLRKFKKHGEEEVEINPNKYKFVGKFEKNKRISGIFTPFKHPNIKEMNILNYADMKTEYTTTIVFKNANLDRIYLDQEEAIKRKLETPQTPTNETPKYKPTPRTNVVNFEYLYSGKVKGRKLNDNMASLKAIREEASEKKVLSEYEGAVVGNIKMGIGKYFWSKDEFYCGKFENNKPHTGLPKDKANFGIILKEGKEIKVAFDRGNLAATY